MWGVRLWRVWMGRVRAGAAVRQRAEPLRRGARRRARVRGGVRGERQVRERDGHGGGRAVGRERKRRESVSLLRWAMGGKRRAERNERRARDEWFATARRGSVRGAMVDEQSRSNDAPACRAQHKISQDPHRALGNTAHRCIPLSFIDIYLSMGPSRDTPATYVESPAQIGPYAQRTQTMTVTPPRCPSTALSHASTLRCPPRPAPGLRPPPRTQTYVQIAPPTAFARAFAFTRRIVIGDRAPAIFDSRCTIQNQMHDRLPVCPFPFLPLPVHFPFCRNSGSASAARHRGAEWTCHGMTNPCEEVRGRDSDSCARLDVKDVRRAER
ncbi:hypothetical protein B0H15DRAFT_610246 [Mycena belliarum]|uniref:Uncharacterized protein n=1 Tax=Mycena belliarum TaxID=1033014 RepID=A0AAD6TV42_9AGAR|nr:hypothetical protein B0H15DRAFT_610246 [Mycena belliae]